MTEIPCQKKSTTIFTSKRDDFDNPGLSLTLFPRYMHQFLRSTLEYSFDVVHLDPVGRLCLKDQIMIDQVVALSCQAAVV